MARLRPIKRFLLLLDDQEEQVEGGIIVSRAAGAVHHDYLVVGAGCDGGPIGVGVGDRVVLHDPNAGRRIKLEGTVYRVVKNSDVIAVIEVEQEVKE